MGDSERHVAQPCIELHRSADPASSHNGGPLLPRSLAVLRYGCMAAAGRHCGSDRYCTVLLRFVQYGADLL